MKKERADELVSALRSGKYKQGRGLLRDIDNNFCCLGVACELAVKAGVIDEPEIYQNTHYNYDDEYSFLPKFVIEYFDFKSNSGFLNGDSICEVSLVEMNDDGKTFNEIADFIEENWERL